MGNNQTLEPSWLVFENSHMPVCFLFRFGGDVEVRIFGPEEEMWNRPISKSPWIASRLFSVKVFFLRSRGARELVWDSVKQEVEHVDLKNVVTISWRFLDGSPSCRVCEGSRLGF